MRHAIIALGCGLGLLAGCAAHEVRPAPEASDGVELTPASHYYPLAVGSRWRYRVGEPKGEPVTILLSGREGGFYVDQRGGKLAADAYGIRDAQRYLLRDPVRTGTTWTNVISASAAEHYKVLSALAPCEVPAGRFEDCAKVESRARVDDAVTLVNTMTFARGVGLVRVEVVAQTPKGPLPQTSLELEDFELLLDDAPPAD